MLDCLRSEVIGCDIYETGANGVYVSGGLRKGFEPLPVDKMGLYNSGKRASWPIKEAEGFREKPIVVE